ncbi:MAG TPA: hypothetical protein VM409_07465 [Chloroflexia bacterium]|nr:hypothetical protein [Chloroflexia bacterium]
MSDDQSNEEWAREMLKRLGWHPSQWMQIEAYLRMPPEKKVEQMLRFRGEQVRLLKSRLRSEHPGYSEAEIRQLLLEHLELVRERHVYGG